MKKLTSTIIMTIVAAFIIFQLFLAAPAVEESKEASNQMSKRNSYLEMAGDY